MSLRARLLLLFTLLTLLPALPAAWITRELLDRSVELGLHEDLDRALEAGLRRAQSELAGERAALDRDLRRIVAGDFNGLDDRVRVVDVETGRVLVDGPVPPAVEPTPGAPPTALTREISTGSGRLRVTRVLDPAWREDALAVSEALQMQRSLNAQRERIRRGFLAPFVLIYAASLVVAWIAAWLLARGWTVRVDRLVTAMQRLGRGDWSARSRLRGTDELGRLGRGFDDLVDTLDAQNRRLVDLETMAGWREMARALAHEVKNPLTPIQLTVEEMRAQYRGDDPEYRALLDECTRIVVEEVDSLRAVVGRFREFARPVEIQPRPLDVNALVRDVGALQRDLQVEFDLDSDALSVVGDEDRLRQVFMNLASNAREATEGIEDARLRIATRREPGTVVVEFEDNGPGIDARERDRVFEPYRTGKSGGLGLGLALVKGIVLAHDGNITIDRGELGGARFQLRFPAREPTKELR